MKRFSKIILILLLLTLIFRFVYIVVEYNHKCEDDNCPICEFINNFNKDIKRIIPSQISIILVIFISISLNNKKIDINKIYTRIKTLISLKVELLN